MLRNLIVSLFLATLLTLARSASGAEVHADSSAGPQPKWALALSGGIARGFGHAGVIKALEEVRVRPDLVVGASMGGLVGAMYSAGLSADSIRAICRKIPWDIVFTGIPNAYQWRAPWPKPWVQLVSGSGGHIQVPAALVDNTVIDQVLVELFLNADATAQGDFDRLPIPFRTIGTDVRTGRWVLLDRGSLAQACRITCGLPLMFPPVALGDALLVDGGMSSNLPISPARAAGADRVLAIDVALPYPELDESSSGLVVFAQLWDILNKRGQNDTISVAAGDTLIWLRLPKAAAADFAGAPQIIDEAYQEGGEVVRSWARRSGLPLASGPLIPPWPVMPRLASEVEWVGRGSLRHTSVARRVLGKLPADSFHPTELVPALRRLSRSGLFESSWPTLANRGDSTVMSFEVRELPTFAIGPAFTLGNDEGARLYLGLTYRPEQGPLPSMVKAGGAWTSLGSSLQASLEPYALDYGSPGWFARGRYQHRRSRIFSKGEEISSLSTYRGESFLGGQISLPLSQVFQVGAGYASVNSSLASWSGALIAAQSQAIGLNQRTVNAEWAVGSGGYARFDACFTHIVRFGPAALTPGVRFGATDGQPPADALVSLGGPHSMSGLHYDEWLGRRMWAGSLEIALEASRSARAYVAGQVGQVDEAISGADLGATPAIGLGIGAEIDLPIGPLRIEWGTVNGTRDRFDIILGPRF